MSSFANGGHFQRGFLSAGVAQAFAPGIADLDSSSFGQSPMRIAAAAVVGGTTAVLDGGKFANGAVTGAFSRAFNDEYHKVVRHTLTMYEPEVKADGSLVTKDFRVGDLRLVDGPVEGGLVSGLFEAAAEAWKGSWPGRVISALDPEVKYEYQTYERRFSAQVVDVDAVSDFD